MKLEQEIPAFLKHLPTYRGYPVPYFVPKDENGVYQLKYASAEKTNNCIKYDKCCVCFKPLIKKDYWFISGIIGLKNRTDSHAPMHKNCAEYSLNVCPHLFFEKTHRTTDENKASDIQITQKPKELFLIRAKKYKVFKYNGAPVVKYSSHRIIALFNYVNGKLSQVKV